MLFRVSGLLILVLVLLPVIINTEGKAYVMVILNRVRTYLEAQAQQGFRQQRGTPDALFSLRRMMELARQYEDLWTSARPLIWSTIGYCGQYLGLGAWPLNWWT